MTNTKRTPRLQLRLYISGQGVYATRAEQNLKEFAAATGIEYDLELVDLRREPDRATVDAVVVTPTLIKLSPAPRRMVFGDLGDISKMATALGVPLPRV